MWHVSVLFNVHSSLSSCCSVLDTEGARSDSLDSVQDLTEILKCGERNAFVLAVSHQILGERDQLSTVELLQSVVKLTTSCLGKQQVCLLSS